jgi:hypothetical protein
MQKRPTTAINQARLQLHLFEDRSKDAALTLAVLEASLGAQEERKL